MSLGEVGRCSGVVGEVSVSDSGDLIDESEASDASYSIKRHLGTAVFEKLTNHCPRSHIICLKN